VTLRELAAALAGRLNKIVPAGFTVQSNGISVDVYHDGRDLGGTPALDILADRDGRRVSEKIEVAVRAVLSAVQDRVIEELKGPWPGEFRRGADLPIPDCRVAGDQLLLWFGDESAPAISVLAIPLHADI